ncbi:MAG: isoprenylcysteine carboxylmethyltransferase family protein [Deltaproteobacteria bacterium]|nr:isoprenylcysteine carboxylmethyltransferase family protein [Deltaproteobacteria bacterium]
MIQTLHRRIIDFVYRCATGTRTLRLILTPLGGTFFLGLLLLLIYCALLTDRLFRLPTFSLSIPRIIMASLFIALGIALWLWSAWQFFKAKGTPVPFNPPPRLVTSGPYTYVRNPMLTGIFFILFALGIFFRSVSLIFIFSPIFLIVCALEFKLLEEPELEKRLGQEYKAYKKITPMFIPKFRKK